MSLNPLELDNITYCKGISEEIDMPDASLDLLSSAQAGIPGSN